MPAQLQMLSVGVSGTAPEGQEKEKNLKKKPIEAVQIAHSN